MDKLLLALLIGLASCVGGRGVPASTDGSESSTEFMPRRPIGDVIYGADLRESHETDLVQAIISRVPGVYLSHGDGEPQLRIRRGVTIVGNPNPLYVIDGMTLSQGGLSVLRSINVEDLDRIEVLKNASETALYGAQGGSGVIRIWTRRGGSDR